MKLVHVPYKGDAPGTIDLIAGQIAMAVFPPISLVPHVKSGRLRALAVTSLERSTALPDTRTVAESGYPGFESGSWNGIAVRAGTPEAIVRRLHKEIATLLDATARRCAATSNRAGARSWRTRRSNSRRTSEARSTSGGASLRRPQSRSTENSDDGRAAHRRRQRHARLRLRAAEPRCRRRREAASHGLRRGLHRSRSLLPRQRQIAGACRPDLPRSEARARRGAAATRFRS